MGRKPLSDKPKNMSAPLRVLLTDEERDVLNAAAEKPRTADGGRAFLGTSSWAREVLFALAPHAETVEAYCQRHGLGLAEFLTLAVGHQVAREPPR